MNFPYCNYNHITKDIFRNGNFSKLERNNSTIYECKIDIECKNIVTDEVQRLTWHYVPPVDDNFEQAIKDLDNILYSHDSDTVILNAVSTIIPMSKERYDALVEAGDLKTDKFNVKLQYHGYKFTY